MSASTRIRGSVVADLADEVGHVQPFGEPGLDDAFEPLDEPGETLRAHDQGVERLVEIFGRELAALHRLGDPEDHRDRRAELVADAADQLLAVRGALEQRFLRHLELAGPAALAIERVGQLLDHDGCDLRRQQRAAADGLAHRVHDRVAVGVFEHVAGGAGHEHVADRPLLLHAAEGDDPDRRPGGLEPAGRLDPVHLGHPDVHQDDVGHQPHGHLDRFGAGACLADHFEVLPRQEEDQRLSEPIVVVDDEHADAFRGAEGGGRAHLGSIGVGASRGYPAVVGFGWGTRGWAG